MARQPPHDAEAELAKLVPRWSKKKAARPLYRIRDWMLVFESSETRTYSRLYSIRLPNKHDGKGYGRLCRHTHSLEIFGAFVLAVQIASKMPARGYLCDEEGPFDAEDMADMSRMPVEPFEWMLAFTIGEKIEWLEIIRELPVIPGHGADTGESPENPRTSPGKRTPPGESPGTPELPEESPAGGPIPGEFRYRIGEDRIGSTHTGSVSGEAVASVAAGAAPADLGASVRATFERMCLLDWFGRGPQKKRAPGFDAERALAMALESSALEESDWAALAWLYRQPQDEGDIELRQRRRTPERLAPALIGEIERAKQLMQERGVSAPSAGTRTAEKKTARFSGAERLAENVAEKIWRGADASVGGIAGE